MKVRFKHAAMLVFVSVVVIAAAWHFGRAREAVFVPGRNLPEWTVDSLPFITVGSAAGDGNHDLNLIRGAAVLSDTSILVSNGGGSDVRAYDGAGRFVRRYGGSGSGPKEYRFAGRLTRLPGSHIAVVVAPRDYVEFDEAGVEIRRVRIRGDLLLAGTSDEYGIQRVHLYHLRRTAG